MWLVLLFVIVAIAAAWIAVAVVRGGGIAAPPPTPTTPAAASALEALDELDERSGWADVRYDRARFGEAWEDVDRNGCDTRNDILGRDLLDPVFRPGTNGCKVLAGVLIDPYDGSRVDFISGPDTSPLVQIDHVVSLSWAWHRGADAWTDESRLAFANDPRNLRAASEATNQEKGRGGPADWLPPASDLRCAYVESFVAVLAAYDLGIDDRDRSASEAVLRSC